MLDLHQASCKGLKWEGSIHGFQEPLPWAQQHRQHGCHATAEHKLINATYRGERRCWDFERYAAMHKEQHTILEGLEEYEYAGIDEGGKTRLLLAGIRQQHLTVSRHRSCAMLNSGKTLPNVWSYSRTILCKPRLTSPKSSIFSQLPPGLKLNRKRGNPKEELRKRVIPFRNTGLYPMNRRRN